MPPATLPERPDRLACSGFMTWRIASNCMLPVRP